MRRRVILRRTRLPRAVLGLPMLTLPALGAGLAYAAGPAGHTSSSRSITANVRQRRIAYGDELIVTGRTPSSQRYHSVRLSFSPVGGRHWRRIASARVGPHDRFRFHVRLRSSGRVRVTGWQPSSTSGDPGSGGATIPTTTSPQGSNPSASAARAQSRPHRVTVAARLHVGYHAARDLGGHAITVPGTLAPADRGRHVRLDALVGGRWRTVANGHTGGRGHFRLRYTPHHRQERLRVRFGGDRSNAPAKAGAGSVTIFTQSVASWYEDGGSTACGFHAYYGVANRTLPCGTKVAFIHNGHSVTATVDDRGPYVGGRTWDLNQNTASALGFDGVGDVWSSR